MVKDKSVTKHIGIMGGAFNPFHHGHLRHAIEIKEELNLDGIDLVPSYNHPHKDKEGLLPYTIRIQCIQKSIEHIDFIRINRIEEHIMGKSYTDVMLNQWKKENPDYYPYFLMGIEDFAVLPTWHCGTELPLLAPLIIVSRHGKTAEDFLQIAQTYWDNCTIQVENKNLPLILQKKATIYVHNKLYCQFIQIPNLEITATHIRELWIKQKNLQGLLNPLVIQFLNKEYKLIQEHWQ